MARVLYAFGAAAFLISSIFGAFWLLALPVVLIGAIGFGLPLLLLARKLGWLAWWQAMIAGGLSTVPVIWVYLSMNAAATERVGLRNSVYALGMGLFGGLIVWGLGVFRNPRFTPIDMALPKSVFLSVPILVACAVYHIALKDQQVQGQIISYEAVDNPTPWEHARVTVLMGDGVTFQDMVSERYSDPAVVGECASVFKRRAASLTRFVYIFERVEECKDVDPAKGATVRSDDMGGKA